MRRRQPCSEITRDSLTSLLASVLGPGLGSVGTLAFPVFLSSMAQEYGGRGSVSGLLAAAALASYLAHFLVGAAVDRWGARRVLPFVSAYSAATVALLGLSGHGTLVGVFVLFILMGLGNATVAAYARLNALWFRRHRGLAFAVSSLGVGLIWTLLIPQAAQTLLSHCGWRGAYGIMGLAALVMGAPLVAVLVRDPPGLRDDSQSQLEGVTVSAAWVSPIFWLIIIGVCAEAATVNSTRSHLVTLLTDRGLTQSTAVAALATTLIGMLIGQPLAGWLLDKVASAKVVIPFALCSLVGLVLLSFGATAQGWFAGLIIMNVGYSGELLLAPYFLTRYFGRRHHGKIHASIFVFAAPVIALSPYAMGSVFDRCGTYQPILVTFAAALCVGGLALALLPAYRFSVDAS